jgi:hypothetical protein
MDLIEMKSSYLFLLTIFCLNSVWADFSNSTLSSHPILPQTSPFIIDIQGEWPTDCHPGEQKPIIREYDGDSVLIEFEIIVEHVTCNDVPTPYRVLVDMSDVIGSVEAQGNRTGLDVTVRFGGAELNSSVLLSCPLIPPCPYSPSSIPEILPEAGLYHSDTLDKQGLVLARQNHALAAYPLIYDDTGSSEWLFGGGRVVQDTYFTDLYELSGGQCLGCPPTGEPIQMDIVGKLTLLMDSQGLVQLKVNDGLFEPYQQTAFGYGEFEIASSDDDSLVNIQDLSGRWAFSESDNGPDNSAPPPTAILPLVFDVTLRSNIDPPPPTIGTPSPDANTHIFYSLLNIEGVWLAEMICRYSDQEMVCDMSNPVTDDNAEFEGKLLSVERMMFTNSVVLDPEEESGKGIAVRID